MPVNSLVLRNELLTDPQGYGYAPLVAIRNDQGLADVLNWVRDGVTACPVNGVVGPAVVVRKGSIASKDIAEAIDLADYPSLPTNPNNTQLSQERRALSYLEMIINLPTVRLLNADGSNTPVASNLLNIFPAGTGTRNRLIALGSKNGTRGESLFGENTNVTAADIANALN